MDPNLVAFVDKMEQQFMDQRKQLEMGPAARRLQAGGPDNNFTTELTSGAEQAFQNQQVGSTDTGEDYDLRGAFADGTERDSIGHLPDTYKKPSHPTFSDESAYAVSGPGNTGPGNAGHWVGGQFQPQAGPPAWLNQYMDSTQPEVKALDRVGANKYLQEQNLLRQLKDKLKR